MREVTWSVIIPSYNSSGRLKLIIDKLNKCASFTNKKGEIIIINDKSTNKFDYASLKQSNVAVKVIHNKKNVGQSKSRNIATNKSTGKILIFLDDDCVPSKDSFISDIIDSYDMGQHIIAGNIISTAKIGLIENIRFSSKVSNQIAEPKDIRAGCLIIDRGIFMSIKGFSEDIRYFEDLDLGCKINRINEKIYISSKISAMHLDHSISLVMELQKTYEAYKSSYTLIIARYPEAKDSFYWATILVGRESIIDRVVFHKIIFRIILRIYLYMLSHISKFMSIEIYNYLHRCVIYYAVKNMVYA